MCCLSRISSRFVGQPSNINIQIGSYYEFYYELNSSCLHLWITTVSHLFAMTYLNCHTAEHCMYLHTLSYGRRRSFLFSCDKTMIINSRCSLKPWADFQPMGPWTRPRLYIQPDSWWSLYISLWFCFSFWSLCSPSWFCVSGFVV